jgi:hypothetical protein
MKIPEQQRMEAYLASMRQEVKGTVPAGKQPFSHQSRVVRAPKTYHILLWPKYSVFAPRDYLAVEMTKHGMIANLTVNLRLSGGMWAVFEMTGGKGSDLVYAWVNRVLANRKP